MFLVSFAAFGWVVLGLVVLVFASAFFGPKGIAWFNKNRKKDGN